VVAVRGPERGDPPGILTLLNLVEEHRGAFEYDWRTRFGCAFNPPHTTSWGESYRLMLVLSTDPSSAVAAAVAGWAHPVTREWAVLADTYDAFVAANTRKGHAKKYPRPWDEKKKRFGRTTHPQSVVRAALRARGHDI
jgi:hypothetical protein